MQIILCERAAQGACADSLSLHQIQTQRKLRFFEVPHYSGRLQTSKAGKGLIVKRYGRRDPIMLC